MTLAGPLRFAVDEALSAVDDEWTVTELVELTLAALRADPDTLVALAVQLALNGIVAVDREEQYVLDTQLAAAILDALLGPAT